MKLQNLKRRIEIPGSLFHSQTRFFSYALKSFFLWKQLYHFIDDQSHILTSPYFGPRSVIHLNFIFQAFAKSRRSFQNTEIDGCWSHRYPLS